MIGIGVCGFVGWFGVLFKTPAHPWAGCFLAPEGISFVPSGHFFEQGIPFIEQFVAQLPIHYLDWTLSEGTVKTSRNISVY